RVLAPGGIGCDRFLSPRTTTSNRESQSNPLVERHEKAWDGKAEWEDSTDDRFDRRHRPARCAQTRATPPPTARLALVPLWHCPRLELPLTCAYRPGEAMLPLAAPHRLTARPSPNSFICGSQASSEPCIRQSISALAVL